MLIVNEHIYLETIVFQNIFLDLRSSGVFIFYPSLDNRNNKIFFKNAYRKTFALKTGKLRNNSRICVSSFGSYQVNDGRYHCILVDAHFKYI